MVKFLSRFLSVLCSLILAFYPCLAVNQPANAVSKLKAEDLINIGRATFNIQSPKFDCKSFFNSVKGIPVLYNSFLFNTFGNDNSCLTELMNDPRLAFLQVHLINEPCHRNRRCGPYEFLSKVKDPETYDKLLIKKDKKLKQRFFRYVQPVQQIVDALPPQVACVISPGLESNVDKGARTLIAWTRQAFPRCRVAWNPLKYNGKRYGADLLEGHGGVINIQAPCIANLDGTDISFPQRPSRHRDPYVIHSGEELQEWIQTYANRCEVAFLWTVEDNCSGNVSSTPITVGNQSFIDPRKRSCKPGKVNKLITQEMKKAIKASQSKR